MTLHQQACNQNFRKQHMLAIGIASSSNSNQAGMKSADFSVSFEKWCKNSAI